jgi:hypothetical protein
MQAVNVYTTSDLSVCFGLSSVIDQKWKAVFITVCCVEVFTLWFTVGKHISAGRSVCGPMLIYITFLMLIYITFLEWMGSVLDVSIIYLASWLWRDYEVCVAYYYHKALVGALIGTLGSCHALHGVCGHYITSLVQ